MLDRRNGNRLVRYDSYCVSMMDLVHISRDRMPGTRKGRCNMGTWPVNVMLWYGRVRQMVLKNWLLKAR